MQKRICFASEWFSCPWSEVLEKLALICEDKIFKNFTFTNCDDSKFKEIIRGFFDQNQYTKEVDNL